ncbi:hypothetical protein DPMN_028471 [Dreissena polymorpha]|uniref:Uncharacterized protein n=1 Tax=Dreissena polymorpha TaxID=45954 RepID=A0A9D4LUS6_DREPO|nr:hypothetical protein DPMN_028471 [Dreissena polymorpha]
MDSDLITAEEVESSFDEELLLEPEGEGSTPSKSWAEQMDERDRVWTAAAQRIIAERSGKVPTACSPDVEVLDANNNISASPVAGHSNADHNQAAPYSNGRGYGRPWYGRRPRGRRSFDPRRWERSQSFFNNKGKNVQPVPRFEGDRRGKYNFVQPLPLLDPRIMPVRSKEGFKKRPQAQRERYGGNDGVSSIKRPRVDSCCPVRSCGETFDLRHVLKSHVPQVMDLRVPLSESLTRRRLAFLMALGVRVVRDGTSVGDLALFAYKVGYVPKGGGEKPSQVGAAEAIARLTGEEANTFFSLLDWSVLGRLWALLTCDEQKFFQETYSLTAEEQESRWQVAVDSHCHLDRWSIKVGVSLDGNILTHLKDHSPLVEIEVNVKAMVTNFCDPPTYPDVSLLKTLSSMRCFPTIGLHPKGASKYSDTDINQFAKLLGRPEVVGFGEVGLDHSVPYTEWLGQSILLRRVLGFLEERHVLILHCRGSKGDQDGREVNMRLLSILHGLISPNQRIHLHCFRGDLEMFRAFTDSFPNTYVGYTHKTSDLSPAALLALRTIPTERLLVETDAPYFVNPTIGPFSSPNVVGLAARNVGMIRGESTRDVLTATVSNFEDLYRLKL